MHTDWREPEVLTLVIGWADRVVPLVPVVEGLIGVSHDATEGCLRLGDLAFGQHPCAVWMVGKDRSCLSFASLRSILLTQREPVPTPSVELFEVCAARASQWVTHRGRWDYHQRVESWDGLREMRPDLPYLDEQLLHFARVDGLVREAVDRDPQVVRARAQVAEHDGRRPMSGTPELDGWRLGRTRLRNELHRCEAASWDRQRLAVIGLLGNARLQTL